MGSKGTKLALEATTNLFLGLCNNARPDLSMQARTPSEEVAEMDARLRA
jgi:hypothetical protein